MGTDRPVARRQEPGASVQLVALGAGELQGPGEGTDGLAEGSGTAAGLLSMSDFW
ncbi:hypothetical protein [Streptomyces plumbiresistens]|uniref:Uncharacterized protein n=1 Tax=Streptomyces plumbiresistens TaxID=511811 RepID=A0ABP7QJ19_9ACTN